ncbi:DNA repair ATPase [Streptomyces sp. NBC_01602]|uniref:DNA repair ATPase n=1 Tax=Streptomyces sp. NBC_01602 TaxID=2975893 RepID=UPI003864A865
MTRRLIPPLGKLFPDEPGPPRKDLAFDRAVRSPNGEDLLFVLRAQAEGRSLLLPYNLICKEIANPVSRRGDHPRDGPPPPPRAPHRTARGTPS